MSGIQLITVISESGQGRRCENILRSYGCELTLISSGVGTATGDMLRLLGLSRTEKRVIFALCSGSRVREAMTEVVAGTRTVAFSVALSSISLPLFREDGAANMHKKEGASSMNQAAKHEVVVVMANRGYIDLVMDAARTAGAGGGTVIHARSNDEKGGHFFNVTLAQERDMFFIVTPFANRAAIMQAIVRDAGMNSPAKAIVFSMPITHLAGFSQYNRE